MESVPPTAAPVAAPVDVEELRPRVDAALREFLTDQAPTLAAVGPQLAAVQELAGEYLAGGKRLRPAFCYWGWRATGLPGGEGIVRAAAALELLQACALVHDDVMDGSDTRRGRPSAHKRFEAHHASAGWTGAPAGFGLGAAILLGDLYLVWSDQLFTTCGLPEPDLRRARGTFDAMRAELMGGQYLDLVVQAEPEPSIESIRSVLQYKSAKYSIERPLHLGAVLAGAPPEVVSGLRAFGLPLGEAFQLRDDLLGVFGDPAVTGKPAGDDLREGKQTLLVAITAERLPAGQRHELRSLLGDPTLTAEQVAVLRDLIKGTGAVSAVEEEIDRLLRESLGALAETDIDPAAEEVLRSLARAAVHRSK